MGEEDKLTICAFADKMSFERHVQATLQRVNDWRSISHSGISYRMQVESTEQRTNLDIFDITEDSSSTRKNMEFHIE